ncbi:MAG: hypothetical protein HYT79_03060 [Elusimicrobia bacterium]|nr:hypothetical protein [Elusimicrobiota bacterium]
METLGAEEKKSRANEFGLAQSSSSTVAVAVTQAKEGYHYQYTISYPTGDLYSNPFGRVGQFRVDLRHNPLGHSFFYPHREPETEPGDEHDRNLDEVPRVYPVKKLAPLLWDHKYVLETPYHGWWTCPSWADREASVKPGQKLSGFILITKEPPGIRNSMLRASNETDWNEDYYQTTLAPASPPEPFTASAWTARMLSDVAEARKLGWIKSDDQLDKIKKLIADLNTQDKKKLKKAVNVIEKYVSKEHKAGRLTDEADALVRLNALYLLKRMNQEEKGKK